MPKRTSSESSGGNGDGHHRPHSHPHHHRHRLHKYQRGNHHSQHDPPVPHQYGIPVIDQYQSQLVHPFPPPMFLSTPEAMMSFPGINCIPLPEALTFIPNNIPPPSPPEIIKSEVGYPEPAVQQAPMPAKNSRFTTSMLYVDGYSPLDEPDEFELEAHKIFFSKLMPLMHQQEQHLFQQFVIEQVRGYFLF